MPGSRKSKRLERYEPEQMWNYSPVIRPMPVPGIDNVCAEPLVCVVFSEKLIPYLLGLIEIYRWPDRFEGTPEEQEIASGVFMDLMEVLAMACGCDSVGTSITITTMVRVTVEGHLQISVDGGATWTPHPLSPEVKAPQIPYVGTGDATADKCNAASNVVQHLQDVKAQVSVDLDRVMTFLEYAVDIAVTVLEAIFIFLAQPELLIMIPMLAAWAKRWYGESVETWEAVWTSAVWDAMTCILFCRIGDNGKFTETTFGQVIADLETKIPGGTGASTAGESLKNWLQMWQTAGLNTAAANGASATADCSDCDCLNPCALEDWTVVGEFGIITLIDETHIQVEAVFSGGAYYGIIQSADQDIGCAWQGSEFTVGGASSLGYDIAGEERVSVPADSCHHSSFNPPIDTCIAKYSLQDGSPFTYILHLTECP